MENINAYLESVIKAYCRYTNRTYVAPEEIRDIESDEFYRVQVGAFFDKNNAEQLQAELKSKGYDPIIVIMQKDTQ